MSLKTQNKNKLIIECQNNVIVISGSHIFDHLSILNQYYCINSI